MNRESTWEECRETNAAVNVSPDKAKIKSLLDTAMGRNRFLNGNAIMEDNANYIFEGLYASLAEMLHVLVLKHGYQVGSHICLGYYLRDVLKKEDLFRLFDDCRIKRNGFVYYGRKMHFETAKESIVKCKRLMEEIEKLVR